MSLQSVIITGASRGLGLEFVKQLLASDKPPKYLIATARQTSNEELNKLKAKNSSLHVLQLDTKNYKSFDEFEVKVKQIVGDEGIDTLINNAGIIKMEGFKEVTDEDMLEVYRVNTVAPVLLTKALLSSLKTSVSKNKKTAVINVSSDLGSIELNTKNQYGIGMYFPAIAYRASKAALDQVSKTMSNELEDEGIIVISLHPGWVQTDMGGPNAHLIPETSISNMLRTIKNIKKEDAGKLINYDGSILPY